MKKLITLLLLISTTLVFAQKQEFTEYYGYSKVTEASGVKKEWKKLRTAITFNYKGDSGKIVFQSGEVFLELYQVGTTLTSKTDGGLDYEALKMIDSDGTEYIIQYFKDQENYGVRLFFSEGMSVDLVR